MPSLAPLVALVSAVPAAIGPITAAMQDKFPSARLWNLLDDRLLVEAGERGGVTVELQARMRRLIDHASTEGADAILLTCSMYAPVAQAAAHELTIPIFGPDDAVIAAATSGRYHHVLVISSAEGPLEDSMERVQAAAAGRVVVTGRVADGAATAVRVGDTQALAKAIADTVRAEAGPPDAVLLGQYSLAPAADEVQSKTGIPILAGPRYAVCVLQQLLVEQGAP